MNLLGVNNYLLPCLASYRLFDYHHDAGLADCDATDAYSTAALHARVLPSFGVGVEQMVAKQFSQVCCHLHDSVLFFVTFRIRISRDAFVRFH